MTLLLDTSVLIALRKQDTSVIKALFSLLKTHPKKAVIAFMVYYEFYHGLANKSKPNADKAMEYLNSFNMLDPTKETAEILSELNSKYQAQGVSLHLADLMIAAQAIEHNMTLVTRDDHFGRINELKSVVV